jgi:hypothetical protein
MASEPTAANNNNWLSPDAEMVQKTHATPTSGPGVMQFQFKIVVQDGPKVGNRIVGNGTLRPHTDKHQVL